MERGKKISVGDSVRNTGAGGWETGVVVMVVPAGYNARVLCRRAGVRNISLKECTGPRPCDGYIVRVGSAHYFPRRVALA